MFSEKLLMFLSALCVTAALGVGIYLGHYTGRYFFVAIVIALFTTGFVVSVFVRRAGFRFSLWLLISLVLVSPFLITMAFSGEKVDTVFFFIITSYPFVLIICGAGMLAGYFAHPLIERWSIDNSSSPQNESYRGPRCVACNEPIAANVALCPKCGWTQPR